MNKGIAYKDKVDKIVIETEHCAGCRTCELACSYHHKKVFSPSISSIEITDRLPKPSCAVSFYLTNTDGHLACDICEGEDEPLCLKYCSILMRDELKTFLKRDLPQKLSSEGER